MYGRPTLQGNESEQKQRKGGRQIVEKKGSLLKGNLLAYVMVLAVLTRNTYAHVIFYQINR